MQSICIGVHGHSADREERKEDCRQIFSRKEGNVLCGLSVHSAGIIRMSTQAFTQPDEHS